MLHLLERPIVRIPLYGIFTVVIFMLCMLLTFPDERIKQIMIVQAEAQLNKGKTGADDETMWEVEIEDLDLWWFSGLELHGVKLKERWTTERKARADKEAAEGAPPQLPLTVAIPRVAGRVSLLQSLISLGPAGVFHIDFEEGGLISGTFAQSSDGISVDTEFDQVDMFKSKLLQGVTGVPAFGDLNGTINIVLDPKTRQPSSGSIDLKGTKLTVGPATVKTDKLPSMAYLEVPQTNFGNLTLKATISKKSDKAKEALLTFDDFNAKGRDIHMDVWGDVKLAKNTARSTSNVDMRLKFDETFVKENSLGPILNIQIFRAGKSADNWFGLSFKGPVGKLKPRGSMRAARGPSAGGADKDAAAKPSSKKSSTKKMLAKPPAKKSRTVKPAAPEEADGE